MSLKEIARVTGLSVPTVGNVLGRSASRYSAETRQKVLEAARQIGYKPNSNARAMRAGRSGCAALVLRRSHQITHSHIPIGLLDGIDEELARHNMHLTISRLSDEELSSDEVLPKVLREYLAEGMIINYTHEILPKMIQVIESHHTPAVWLNAPMKRDCVYPDDYGAARDTTKKLIELGHRRIAFVKLISPFLPGCDFEQTLFKMHYSIGDRRDGYVAAMRSAGLTPQVIGLDRLIPFAEHQGLINGLLRGGDRPTAVMTYCDMDLSLVMSAAAVNGLAVPRDLSVLAFLPEEPWTGGKRVSVVPIPTAEMGRRAVRMLLEKVNDPDAMLPPQVVKYEAKFGETVAPPPAQT